MERLLRTLRLGEWLAVSSGAALALTLAVAPWFAISVEGFTQSARDATAFESLGGLDIVLLQAALLAVALPLLRGAGTLPLGAERLGVWIAGVGAVATVLILYLIASPPEPTVERFGGTATDPSAALTVKAGAVAGLLAALGILAGGLLTQVPARPPGPEAAPRPGRTPEPKRRATRSVNRGTRKVPRARASRTSTSRRPRPGRQPASASAPAAEPPAQAPPAAPATVALSAIDLDGLMGLGLSRTQAKRVIRYRDELGLVSSVAELETVPGIPKAVRAELRAKLRD